MAAAAEFVQPSGIAAANSILDQIGATPMVALRSIGAGLRQPLLAKCEHLNPGGSVKDRLALSIIDDAERRGVLPEGGTIVEASAGNTGLGLALVGCVRGYRVVCVLPEKMSVDKRSALRAAGAELVLTPSKPLAHPDNFRQVARRLAADNGWLLADQFANPANPAIHEATTGPEILEQAGGHVGAFVATAGTGGTITGVGRFLRRACPTARIVLADPIGSVLADYVEGRENLVDGPYAVEGIGTSVPPPVLDRRVVDAAERVSDDESFAMTGRLIREEGLLVGGSAGTATVAALRVAAAGDIEGPVVVLLPDSWDRYRSTPWMAALAATTPETSVVTDTCASTPTHDPA